MNYDDFLGKLEKKNDVVLANYSYICRREWDWEVSKIDSSEWAQSIWRRELNEQIHSPGATCAPCHTWLQFDASFIIMDSIPFTFFSWWIMFLLLTRVSNICNKLYLNLPKQY